MIAAEKFSLTTFSQTLTHTFDAVWKITKCYLIASLITVPTKAALPAVLDLNNLNCSDGVIILQDRPTGYYAGYSLGLLGDINGDGISDLIFGDHYTDPLNRMDAGEAYIIFGKNGTWPCVFSLSSLNNSTGVVLQGRSPIDFLGRSVSAAGDINGDGISDILVNSRADPNNKLNAGEVYIIFGRNSSWPAIIDITNLNSSIGIIIQGGVPAGHVGYDINSAGDINGDGLCDILLDAIDMAPLNRAYAGVVYLIFGRKNFESPIFNLENINATTGVMILGKEMNDQLYRVSLAGDVNGDGTPDLLLGSNSADPHNQTNAGEAYIIFGRNGSWPDVIDLRQLNASIGVALQGWVPYGYAGAALSFIGDINHDGLSDIAVGAWNTTVFNRMGSGAVYVLYGRNGTWPAELNLSALDNATGFTMYGRSGDALGYVDIGFAGDVNHDGMTDMIIGAFFAGPLNRTGAGTIYVLYGRKERWPLFLDLDALDNNTGMIIQGQAANDHLGVVSRSAGDINNDGICDMLFGAPEKSPGRAYIIFGQGQAAVPTQASAPSPALAPSSMPFTPTSESTTSRDGSSSINSSPSTSPIMFNIIVSSNPILIETDTITVLNINTLSITGNVNPDQVVYTVQNTNGDIIITVNGVEVTQFTQADVEGQFVEIALNGVTCGDYSTDLQLEANVAGGNVSPQRVDVGLIFEGTTCANAAHLSAFSFRDARISFWGQKRETGLEARPGQSICSLGAAK